MAWYTILTLVVSALMTVMMLYQLAIGLFAFKSFNRPGPADRFHRFALVVAARNEEAVIGCLLDTFLAQEYPREAFDIFVIADNCTDKTAQIAASKGARVFCRQDPEKKSKGFALNWFFQQFLPQYQDQYDAIGIFDADNLVDPEYLAEMNRQLCAGEVAVAGYKDSKNAGDNIITATSAMGFWMISRFYNQPRQILRLMTPAAGTGFVFLTRLIADGWHTVTISEDTEFTLKMAMAGHRIGYTPYARVYDEQAVSLWPSLQRRLRWAAGNYQNIRHYLLPLLRSFNAQNWPLVLDSICFLLIQPGFGLQLLITLIGLSAALLDLPVQIWSGLLSPLFYSSLIGLGSMYLQTALILLVEKKFSWKTLPGALFFPFYLVSNAVIYLAALFIRQPKWQLIAHPRAINLSQIEK